MRYDEAVTYMYFVRMPWPDALSLYTYPNNHLFHTLLAKIAVTIFGNSPWALRLPAFIAGLVLVPATYAVARVLYGSRPALIATALVASSGVLTLYSTNARGYAIVGLAFLLLVLLAVRLLRDSDKREWLAFAVIAALGLWTIPVMLYPLGAVCFWFVLSSVVEDKTAKLRPLGLALAATAVLTLLLYAPVISREGLDAITRNRFVVSSGWGDFFEILPRTLKEAITAWTLGVSPALSAIFLLCAVVALTRHASVSRFRVGIPLAAFVWCAWLLLANHRAPFARVWHWFFPVAAALAGAGLVALLERWPRTRAIIELRTPAISVALAVVLGASVVLSYAVLITRDTGTFREAEEAAAALRRVLRPGDRVLAAIPTNGPLSYYLDKLGVPPSVLTLDERQAARIIAVVDQGEGQSLPRLIARSVLRDTTQFNQPVVIAQSPSSTIVLFERRHAQTR